MTMERTLPFDDPPRNDEPPDRLPHKRGSKTSKLAAQLAKPFACKQLVRVYRYFVERGDDGATDDECQVALNLNGDSQRPRRDWLSQHGYLSKTKNKRLTRKGRPADVHVWSGKVLPKSTATNSAAIEQSREVSQHG